MLYCSSNLGLAGRAAAGPWLLRASWLPVWRFKEHIFPLQNATKELPRGPEPPLFNVTSLTLLPSLGAENAPASKTFGDVLEEVRAEYREVRASGSP